MRSTPRLIILTVLAAIYVTASTATVTPVFGQTKRRPAAARPKTPVSLPTVVQIDDARMKQLLQPKNGRPLLVNFWATWCDPCREEFPDLVKIDADYRGRIDFLTVSLDDVADIRGAVPKFLAEMKAGMPAYLLVSQDESAIITAIAKDWAGGLPFTVLYNEKGEVAYFRQGKVIVDVLRSSLDKLVAPSADPAARALPARLMPAAPIAELPSSTSFRPLAKILVSFWTSDGNRNERDSNHARDRRATRSYPRRI